MDQLAVGTSNGGTPPTQSQYLTFRLGEEEYGVPILAVHEIKGQSAITPLPNAPPCIPGVMNLRGTIVPVVDLRTKFGLPEVEHSRFTGIVLVVVGAKIVGMRVDAVTDVVSLAPAEIQAVPALGGAHAENGCVSGLARTGDKLLVLLDVDRVLDEEFRGLFIEETTEQLAEFEAGVLRLEQAPHAPDAVDVIFRFAHSLKGSSSMMGFTEISRFTHVLESLLEQVRVGGLSVTPEVIDALLASADVLRTLLGQIAAAPDAAHAAPEALERVRSTIDALLASAGAREALPDSAGASNRPGLIPPPAIEPATPGTGESPRRRASDREEATAIRVAVDKVDRLVDLVGELVTAQTMLAQAVADATPDGMVKVHEMVARMDRHTRELHHNVLAVRMVSVRTLFARFPRFVRDLAEAMRKRVVVELAGEETELDKSVIEKIGDPLLHLVRNAIDHGLESPAARLAAGKPVTGRVRLEASQRGGSVYIEVGDDGRGLDRERILSRGRAQGLVRAGETPSDEEVFALIFRPGFSTAETVSEISGRGVGMDVVKQNVEALGGSLAIRSEAGRGTRFLIKLPLT